MLRKHVGQPWFDEIVRGQKTFEGRTGNKIEEWDLDVGKRMIFFNGDQEVCVEIHTLKTYTSFENAFQDLGWALIPRADMTAQKAGELYAQLNIADPKVHGVVAIGFHILRNF